MWGGKKADKIGLKKKQTAQMAEFRTIILESKVQPAPVTTPPPVFPVVSPTPIFTSITERREKFPKKITYHGVKREFQPWYFQIRVKLQMDFTHLSEQD